MNEVQSTGLLLILHHDDQSGVVPVVSKASNFLDAKLVPESMRRPPHIYTVWEELCEQSCLIMEVRIYRGGNQYLWFLVRLRE